MRIRRRSIQALLALPISLIFVPQSDAHGGDPDLIHACISKDGVVRIVGPNDNCAKSETARHGLVFDRATSLLVIEKFSVAS
jgi:hypothetical protein